MQTWLELYKIGGRYSIELIELYLELAWNGWNMSLGEYEKVLVAMVYFLHGKYLVFGVFAQASFELCEIGARHSIGLI